MATTLPSAGVEAIVSGWGVTAGPITGLILGPAGLTGTSPVLRAVAIPIYNHQKCAFWNFPNIVTDRMICTYQPLLGGKDGKYLSMSILIFILKRMMF